MADVSETTQTAEAGGTITARAAVLREEGKPLSIEEVQLEELQENEVLVKVRGVGICHTDIAVMEGTVFTPLPAVLGHEGSGVVERVGPGVEDLAPGDHVVLSFDSCGECENCTENTAAYCELFPALNYFGSRLDGTLTLAQEGEEEMHGNWFGQSSFASYAIASKFNTVKVPDDVPLELMGPFGCGFQTGAGVVMNILKPKAGQGIGIFGIGGVGLAALMAAKALGCDPIVAVDTNSARLEVAKELGATHTVNPDESKDLVWEVMGFAAPGLHCTFETVGITPVIRQALEVLRIPGKCVTVGFRGLENEITIDQGHLFQGRQLIGSLEGDATPRKYIPELVKLYQDGSFPVEKIIKTFPLDQINEAIEASVKGEVIKPVVVFED